MDWNLATYKYAIKFEPSCVHNGILPTKVSLYTTKIIASTKCVIMRWKLSLMHYDTNHLAFAIDVWRTSAMQFTTAAHNIEFTIVVFENCILVMIS